jgi:hypothetical protein
MLKLSQLPIGMEIWFPCASEPVILRFLEFSAYHGYKLQEIASGKLFWSFNDRTVCTKDGGNV